jgi:hypothetical protein
MLVSVGAPRRRFAARNASLTHSIRRRFELEEINGGGGARTNGGLGLDAPAVARVEILPGLWRAWSRRGRPGRYRSTPLLVAFDFLVSATQLDLTASLLPIWVQG